MSQPKDRSQSSVSLFPFLAVLICTMGALIVLLVIVVQQARTANAAEVAVPSQSAEVPQLSELQSNELLTAREKLEDIRWQIKQIESNREKTRETLREEQLALSLAEDQVRSLTTQLQRLEKEAESVEMAQADNLSSSSKVDEQTQSLRLDCDRLREEVNKLRLLGDKRSRQFAVIPYSGPNGTNRRPIYVECLEDQVILQPEGIVLTPEDFPAEMDSDNPLAVALRGTREYWLNHRVADSAAEAYPLLIVRPDGARMYAACRAALRGWDDEFGYELVANSMELAYASPDPSLATFLQTAVDNARSRIDPSGSRWTQGNSDQPAGQAFGMTPEEGADAGGNGRGGGGSTGGNGGNQANGSASPTQGGTSGVGGGAEGLDGSQASSAPGASTVVTADSAGTAGLQSIATSRGENWALPNIAGNSIAISRTVSVTVTSAALLLEPESGQTKAPEAFPFEGGTRTAIQPFVNALWREIERWGVAGPGAYWKPNLKIAISDGTAESRFADLVKLLEGSGLTVERR